MKKMKNSNIDWLGNIPCHWNYLKNKHLLLATYSGGTPTATNEKFYASEGIPFVSISDMSSVDFINKTEKFVTEIGMLDKRLKIVPKGTILYSMYATVGHVSELNIDATISQAMIALFINDSIKKTYYKYCLKAMKDYIFSSAEGTTQMNLNAQKVKNFIFPIPPVDEQNEIVTYLDDKCTKIDETISRHEGVISRLQEYKKSLITKTVIQGLNSNIEMKNITTEWIDKVPSHWSIKPLKQHFWFNKGLSITKEILVEQGLPVISYGQIHSKDCDGVHISQNLIRFVPENYQCFNQSIVLPNGFIFADTSEDLDGCGNAIFNESMKNLFAGYHCIVLNPIDRNQDNKYLAYLFKTDVWRKQIRKQLVDVKLFSITQKVLKETEIILPPQEEAKEIADYLDNKCKKIDESIYRSKVIIEKLKEYKKSLIYYAVTGKIDCRKEEYYE